MSKITKHLTTIAPALTLALALVAGTGFPGSGAAAAGPDAGKTSKASGSAAEARKKASDRKKAAEHQPPGFDPQRHMRVDEVEPGMKGYGMTVFHGTEPEPFAVEVVSVQRGFEPGKSVVWIRCPGDRMQRTGPVQGMSGSPIYLWPDTAEDAKGDKAKAKAKGKSEEKDGKKHTPQNHTLGEGGRMIGAFAFGHRDSKGCYAGVQPIENMLRTAGRAATEDRASGDAGDKQAKQNNQTRGQPGSTQIRTRTLVALHRIADRLELSDAETWRLDALSKLVGFDPDKHDSGSSADRPFQRASSPQPLALPVTVGSAEQASLLEPLLAPHGLTVRTAPNLASQLPPQWINEDQAKLEPGSVFAVPLTFGPLEMSAIGTTTEVLPDGTAMAFGHSFFAQGPIAVPMATGFVHFVQPANSVSFKLGGSVKVQGAVVRDENAGIVGKPEAGFPTVPTNVHVRWPEKSLNADYEYKVVHHKQLVPSLVGSLAASSLTSDTGLPENNTITVDAEIRFSDGRSLTLDEIVPRGSPGRVMMALVPAIVTVLDNQFEDIAVESIDATLRVEEKVREAELLSARLSRSIVRPGETVTVHARLKPFRGPTEMRRVELTVPRDVPEGKYSVTVGGVDTYQQLRQMMKPHLNYMENTDHLFEAVRAILGARSDALYTVLRLNRNESLAIGRSELPELPSSRMAILDVQSSSAAKKYVNSVERVEATPWVVKSNATLPLEVRKPNTGGS